MRIAFVIGLVMAAAGLAVTIAGNLGEGVSWPSIASGGVLFVLGGTMALGARGINRTFARQVAAVAELETRGVRRTGRVREAVPYASEHGGAVLQADGAQMVLRIELDGGESVACHLVESSEQARARIGNSIVIVEHPDDPSLRAIEGYLPNGRRR